MYHTRIIALYILVALQMQGSIQAEPANVRTAASIIATKPCMIGRSLVRTMNPTVWAWALTATSLSRWVVVAGSTLPPSNPSGLPPQLQHKKGTRFYRHAGSCFQRRRSLFFLSFFYCPFLIPRRTMCSPKLPLPLADLAIYGGAATVSEVVSQPQSAVAIRTSLIIKAYHDPSPVVPLRDLLKKKKEWCVSVSRYLSMIELYSTIAVVSSAYVKLFSYDTCWT